MSDNQPKCSTFWLFSVVTSKCKNQSVKVKVEKSKCESVQQLFLSLTTTILKIMIY